MIEKKSQENYVVRETITVSTRDLLEKEYLRPEQIRIFLPAAGKKFPTDLGSLAYAKRKYVRTLGNNIDPPFLVVEESLINHRRLFLQRFIDYIVTSGFRDSSISTAIGRVRTTFNYIDEQSYSCDFLKDPIQTELVYKNTSNELKHKVNSNELTPRQAEIIQINIAFVINIHYGKQLSNYISGNSIKFIGKAVKTAPREREELKYAYNIYKSIAETFSDALLNERCLPFLLKMPNYETFIFPYSLHRVTPFCSRPTDVYNHELGRLVTESEYYNKRPDVNKSQIKTNLERATKRLHHANKDPRAVCRRALASTAMQSFQLLFMMLTGAYVSEIAQLEFDDELEFDKSLVNKSYRAIKLRASGRIVQYELAAGAVSLFRKYLKLREWVLEGRKDNFLFFGLGDRSWLPVRISESALRSFQRNKIIGIFMPKDFEMLTARQFRKTKSLFLHEQQDVSRETVAHVLNHSISTNEQHYMEVSPERARDELSNFWEAAQEASRHIIFSAHNDGHKNHKPIAAGHCDDYKHPHPAIAAPPIEPDCRKQYGCLFCMHYICHANDGEDIHKLFSLLYVVTGVLNAVSDIDKANELFLILSVRVRKILLQIKVKSEAGRLNVERYGDLVFKFGELTPYWENRLQRYESLGLIFFDKQAGISI